MRPGYYDKDSMACLSSEGISIGYKVNLSFDGAGVEVCREESRENSVWPAIQSILPESRALQHELFLSNGQPSSLATDAITSRGTGQAGKAGSLC